MLEIGDADHPEASLLGPVTIGAEGKLQGHGTIGGDVANTDGGVLSPGGSIGTLTVGGDYTQGPTSRLRIEVSPTAASQLQVLGNASLAGDLALIYEPGVYADASYDILNAAGITGTFATVTGQTPAGFDPVGHLFADRCDPGPRGRRPDHRDPDQRHDLHGAQHRRLAGGAAGQWRAARPIWASCISAPAARRCRPRSPPRRRRRSPSPAPPISSPISCRQIPQAVGQMGGWFKAIGSFASLDGSITTPGFDTQAGGFLAGFDKAFSPNLTGGIAARLSPHQSERGRRGQRQPRHAAPGGLRDLHAGRFRHRCHGGLCL